VHVCIYIYISIDVFEDIEKLNDFSVYMQAASLSDAYITVRFIVILILTYYTPNCCFRGLPKCIYEYFIYNNVFEDIEKLNDFSVYMQAASLSDAYITVRFIVILILIYYTPNCSFRGLSKCIYE